MMGYVTPWEVYIYIYTCTERQGSFCIHTVVTMPSLSSALSALYGTTLKILKDGIQKDESTPPKFDIAPGKLPSQ